MTKRKRKIIKGNETNLDGCWWGFRNAVRPQRCNVIVVIIVSIRLPPTVPATLHHSFSSSCLFLFLSLFFSIIGAHPHLRTVGNKASLCDVLSSRQWWESSATRAVLGRDHHTHTYKQTSFFFFRDYFIVLDVLRFLSIFLCVCRNSR